MEPGERRPQVALEAVELTGVELARVLVGDGLEAQGARQALSERRGVERLDRHRGGRRPARAEREGALERGGGEDAQHDEEGDGKDVHNAALPRRRAARRW